MSDELDKLTDSELSEYFAVEVAGHVLLPKEPEMTANPTPVAIRYEGRFLIAVWDQPEKHGKFWVGAWVAPQFATSADAVLPFSPAWFDCHRTPDGFQFTLTRVGDYSVLGSAIAPTFARAACIALIRGKRAAK